MHQARITVKCAASRVKGVLHPTKSRLSGGRRPRVRSFLHMDGIVKLLYLLRGGQGGGSGIARANRGRRNCYPSANSYTAAATVTGEATITQSGKRNETKGHKNPAP